MPYFTQPSTSRVQLRYVCEPNPRINTVHDVVILSIGKLLHLLSIARMRHVGMQVAADRESPLPSRASPESPQVHLPMGTLSFVQLTIDFREQAISNLLSGKPSI